MKNLILIIIIGIIAITGYIAAPTVVEKVETWMEE